MSEMNITPQHAEACARVTKELAALVHDGVDEMLDKEVEAAYNHEGVLVSSDQIDPDMTDADKERLVKSLDNVTLDTHMLPSVVVLISFIIKSHTKPSQIESLIKGVMTTLGVDGKIVSADNIVEDIAEQFDI